MGVPRKNICVSAILEILDLDIPLYPLESVYDFAARKRRINRKQCRDSLKGLVSRGHLKIVKKQNQEFVVLTKKGALRMMLQKAKMAKKEKWDGKWRVIIFDIPEDFNQVRDHFRRLLKENNFIKLQASVFISPYPLSREAIVYLNEVRLIKFVRIMKVEEMDNDKELRVRFNLN